MSATKFQEHLLILPEDDAYHAIATSFVESLGQEVSRRAQVLNATRGWIHARQIAVEDGLKLRKYGDRKLLLVIDFDTVSERLAQMSAALPADIRDRIFIIGSANEAEDLRRELGPYSRIGSLISEECRRGATDLWQHPLLALNRVEVQRLAPVVQRLFFPA